MKRSRTRLLLLGILLLAFGLRVYRLDYFSLRGDESFTVLFVQKPLAQMWNEILTVEPNPPLLYVCLRGWIALAGASEFATRYFSVFFGVLCAALGYRVGEYLTSRLPPTRRGELTSPLTPLLQGAGGRIALVVAFLIAINPYQIWHSQDVRNYTMWPALSLLALLCFWRWYAYKEREARGKNSLWTGLLFAVAELAALYTHYYEAFALLALNLFVFATTWRDRAKWGQWLAAQLVLAILYLPYPLLISNRAASYGEGSGRQGVALWDIARETFSSFTLGETLDMVWREWLWIPLALLALAGLWILARRDWRRALLLSLLIAAPTLSVFALNTVRPLYLERYLNVVAPGYYILLAIAVVELPLFVVRPRSRLGASPVLRLASRFSLLASLLVLSFLALTNYFYNPAYAKAPDWRGLARVINANARRGDLIIQNFPETSLLYYNRTALPLVVYPITYMPDAETIRALNAVNSNYQRIWFIPAAEGYWDPDQFVEQWLDHRTDLLDERTAGDLRVRLYATPSSYLNSMARSGAEFGQLIRLNGYRTERRGADLRVVLYWRVLDKPGGSFEVEVRARDANGNVLERLRGTPVRGAYPTSEWSKNELVVDQYDLAGGGLATQVQIRVCDPGASSCLEVAAAPASTRNAVTLPVAP